MKSIGFIKSTMPEETRCALLPGDVEHVRHPERLFFEQGYAQHLGFADDEYRRLGAGVIPRREMARLDVLCVPKFSEKDREILKDGMTIWGWPYVEDNRWCAEAVVERSLSIMDFQFMYKDGEFVFGENSRLAGRLGMMQAMQAGKPPGRLGNVAMIGKGNLAQGAMEVLDASGVRYSAFDSRNSGELLCSMDAFDTIVNCMKWYRAGYLVSRAHIERMKEGAFFVDLSTEGVEGSKPHSIYAPVRMNGHVMMYANEHIPALLGKQASEQISHALAPYVDNVVEEMPGAVLHGATVVVDGKPTAAARVLSRTALQAVSRTATENMS
jgi:N5-(carboxyethyl)ornithine synthase